MLDLFNFIAAIITIIATTISMILWVKYRERDKWAYGSFLSTLEGLNRIVIFTRIGTDVNILSRVGDMVVTLRDNVVSSMKTINPKRTDRLKSWEFGYKDTEDKLREVALVSGEMANPKSYLESIKNLEEIDWNKVKIVFKGHQEIILKDGKPEISDTSKE